jgi:hypothetical protein
MHFVPLCSRLRMVAEIAAVIDERYIPPRAFAAVSHYMAASGREKRRRARQARLKS